MSQTRSHAEQEKHTAELAKELRMIGENVSYELVSNQVLEVLRKNIILGRLQDGERIVEATIAQMSGISRVPVREAIRTLESEGFVMNLPRRGTRVIGVSDEDIREIFRIRGMIERIACDYIIEQASDETIAEGKRILDEAECMLEFAMSTILPLDRDYSGMFNQWIGKANGRRRISALYDQYNRYIAVFRKINSSTDIGRRKQAWTEHMSIWSALAHRDKERAHKEILIHAENSLCALLERRSRESDLSSGYQ